MCPAGAGSLQWAQQGWLGGESGWLQEGEQKATGGICDGHLVLKGSNGIWEAGSCVSGFANLFMLLHK